jgi:hypothetical protein
MTKEEPPSSGFQGGGGFPWKALRPPRAWRSDLRLIGELQVEAAILFERVTNALKLLGDQYLARVYRLASYRFRLPEWNAGILRKLDTTDGIYQKVHDRAASWRMEILEWIIIFLIALSILLPFLTSLGRWRRQEHRLGAVEGRIHPLSREFQTVVISTALRTGVSFRLDRSPKHHRSATLDGRFAARYVVAVRMRLTSYVSSRPRP